MLNRITRLFAPPIFDNPDKTRIARILNYSGWVATFIVFLLIINRAITNEWSQDSTRYTFPFLILIILIMQWIVRQGHVQFAGGFAITLVWLTITYQASQADGLWDVALLAHLAVILLAALLIGWRAGILVGASTFVVVWYFAYQEQIGIRQFNPDPPYLYARDLTSVFLITILLIYYLVYSMNRSLADSKTELKERLRAEAKLQTQADYLTALHETTLGLVNRLELNPLFELILTRTSELLNTSHVAIDLVLTDESSLRQEVGLGIFAEYNGVLTPKGKGLIGKVWQENKVIVAQDYNTWEGRDPEAEYVGFKAVLAAPLKSGKKVTGVLTVANIENRSEFTPEQIILLERLATLASVAIDNARLYQESQDEIAERKLAEEKIQLQAEYLTALQDTTLGLVNRLELKPLLESVIARASELLSGADIGLDLILPDESALIQEMGNGAFANWNGSTAKKGEGISGKIWEQGKAILIENYSEYTNYIPHVVTAGFGSVIGAPLKSEQKVIGVIVAAHTGKQKTFTQEQLSLLERFAALASIAIDNARLYQNAQQEILERKIIETELLASDERFRKVFNNNKVAISIVTLAEGIFLEANEAFWQITGLSPEKALGHSAIELNLWSKPEDRAQFVQELLQTGSLVNVEVLFQDHKPSLGYYEVINIKNQQCIVCMFYDMTEQYQAQQALRIAEARTRAILESIPDMIFEVSREGIFLDFIPSNEITPYLPPEQFLGKHINQVFSAPITERTLFLLERAIDTKQLHAFEYDLQDKGETRYFEARISGVSENSAIVMVRDITQRKWIEAEREILIEELEHKNTELERFTYTVSHDLKSPLITIKGFLGFLEQDALSGNQTRFKSDIQRISDATNKMQSLLNELLNLSRVGRLVNESQQVNFNEIVTEALDLVHGRLQTNKIQVQVQENLSNVYGDRPRLVEVLQNLIDNAAKFVVNQPKPLIQIGQNGFENEMPIFYVRDNGIGIDTAHHDRIFGLFNKLDAESEGTGVGLALVKRIVELHGGKIWVESHLGKGATFYFTLPTQLPE